MKRIFALAGLLATLSGPAMAAATVLPAGGQSGICAASGVQPAFISYPTVPLDSFFNVQAAFLSGATGTITLTRSTDGGATFAPITAGAQTPSALTATGGLNIAPGDANTQFRLECSLTKGSVSWTVTPSRGDSYLRPVGLPIERYARMSKRGVLVDGREVGVAYSSAQFAKLYELYFTPISDTDAGNLTTGYTSAYFTRTNPDGSHTQDTAWITLSIASSTLRDLSFDYMPGEWRRLRAQSVNVVSIVDSQGNAVASATDWRDPSISYVVGSTISVGCYSKRIGNVTPNDWTRCYDPNNKTVAVVPFQGEVNYHKIDATGVFFFSTMLESVDASWLFKANTDGPNPGKYLPLVPDLTALGL